MTKRFFTALITFIALSLPATAQDAAGDGLHKQPWFMDSFLEFGDDLKEAAAEGKDLLIIIEQDGCPYCRELHRVNFARTEITDYIQAHYLVVQLDLYGSRGTVDFDGQELEERDLVEKWGRSLPPPQSFSPAKRPVLPAPRTPRFFACRGILNLSIT